MEWKRQQVVAKLLGFADELKSSLPTEVKQVEENWDDRGNLEFSFTGHGIKKSREMLSLAKAL